jgi:putative ABC transport system permease protein
MLRASLRGLFSRKLRLTLAVVAIVLGVSFLSGAFVLTDSLGARFASLFESINQNIAVQVMPAQDEDDPIQGDPPRLSQADIDRLSEVDGASAVQGDVTAFGVVPFDARDGKPVTISTAPQIGGGVTGDDPFALVSVDEGRWPTAPDEITISRFTAERTHAEVGGRLKVYLPNVNEARDFTVVGTVAYSGDRDSLAGETLILFQLEEAQKIFFGQTGVYSGAFLAAEEGVSQDELLDRVESRGLVPDGFEAKTGEQANEDEANEINEGLSALSTYFLGPFGIVAMIVGSFLIFNTFNIIVAQRARELALMRAMGASWVQVTGSVLVEAVLVGIVGSTLGLLAGIGLGLLGSYALTAGLLGVDLPGSGLTVSATPIVLAYTVGVLVTVISALVPAIKASTVPPLAAMREVVRPDKPLRALSIVGAALAVPGGALLAYGLAGAGDLTLPALLLGVGLVLLGVALLSPLLTRPLAGLIGRVVGWGVSGKLGVRNALRNPRRTAVTAAALMIGVTLVSAATVLASSFKASIDQDVRSTIGAEVIIQTTQTQGPPTGETGFTTASVDEVRELDGVDRVVSLYLTIDAKIKGEQNQQLGLAATEDLAVARAVFGMETAAGSLGTLSDGEFATDANTAEARGWKIGDKVPIELAKGGEKEYELVGTFASTPILSGTVMLPMSANEDFAGPLASQAYVDLADGADAAAITGQIEQIMSDFPLVTVGDLSSLLDQFNTIINIALAVVGVLLLTAILIAVLGIINTLLLSIYERTRELGMLRAVGLGRGGVIRMIGTESVIMAVFGCLLGIVLGVGLGVALAAALINQDFLSVIDVPWGYLVGFVVFAIIAGLFAGVIPAIRAAYQNVLAAIAYE